MFDDFVPCHHCKNYDSEKHWCRLFLMTKVDGCPCGEEAKEDGKSTDSLRGKPDSL
jgi:hypothetical protein